MEKPRRIKRSQHVEYGAHCDRCATELPSEATVCTICGMALTIPVQLPAPRQVAA
jgi:rRNA maturation endonuclease Nob1